MLRITWWVLSHYKEGINISSFSTFQPEFECWWTKLMDISISRNGFTQNLPSFARCNEGDLPLLNFSNLTCITMITLNCVLGKSKVELCDPQCEFWVFISWNCQWFINKVVSPRGISITLLTDLLYGTTFYGYFTINLRIHPSHFDCETMDI